MAPFLPSALQREAAFSHSNLFCAPVPLPNTAFPATITSLFFLPPPTAVLPALIASLCPLPPPNTVLLPITASLVLPATTHHCAPCHHNFSCAPYVHSLPCPAAAAAPSPGAAGGAGGKEWVRGLLLQMEGVLSGARSCLPDFPGCEPGPKKISALYVWHALCCIVLCSCCAVLCCAVLHRAVLCSRCSVLRCAPAAVRAAAGCSLGSSSWGVQWGAGSAVLQGIAAAAAAAAAGAAAHDGSCSRVGEIGRALSFCLSSAGAGSLAIVGRLGATIGSAQVRERVAQVGGGCTLLGFF